MDLSSDRRFVPFIGASYRLDSSASARFGQNDALQVESTCIDIPSDGESEAIGLSRGVDAMIFNHISMMQSMMDAINALMHENSNDDKIMDVLEQFALDASIHLSTVEQKRNKIESGPESDIKLVEILADAATKFQKLFASTKECCDGKAAKRHKKDVSGVGLQRGTR